jgi:hypothetical protein
MVACTVDSRRENGRRLYSTHRPEPERPAPEHTDLDLGEAEQAGLFGDA